ncbi:UNVERIFIED_CONTAM: putative ribonuclease H protein [Sesamum angustifolium]|uniref:Ribonuclease H protein n=1 Tax=Sesamum angustifolium TaxID=2727405 RepID=A0AAW2Q8Q0_9LAMI
MSCVSSVSYSFMLNGSQFGYLKPSRGICQEPPITLSFYHLCRGPQLSVAGVEDLQKSEPLLSRILKARYFSRGEFFDAKVGCNASYTWRNILDAQPILEDGIRWHIGDGRSVQVWDDKWITRPTTFQSITPKNGLCPGLRVADLIDEATRSWKTEQIDNLFWNDDAVVIKAIQLVVFRPLILRLPSLRNNQVLGHSSEKKINCNAIWKARVPNKIKVFLWRVCKEAIPTTSNLIRRTCDVKPACTMCGAPYEDSKHALLKCFFARQAWALADLPWAIISQWRDGMED